MNADIQRTKAYYASGNAEPCDCTYCRNYCIQIKDKYPLAAEYLSELGADIEKPLELIFYDDPPNGKIHYYSCQYVVFGTCEDDHEYKTGNVSFVNNRDCHPCTDIEEPHFVLDLGEIVLDIIIEPEG